MKKTLQPTNKDLKTAFDAHAKEDQHFQDDTRAFNGEMGVFRAETEGSLAELHAKMDAVLNKFDPDSKDYAFEKMDQMYEIYEGLGFSRKMLIVTAGVIGSLAIIIGGIFSAIRYIR